MRSIMFENTCPAVQKLIRDTGENSTKDTNWFRCDRADGKVWVASLQDGRTQEFIEIIMPEEDPKCLKEQKDNP